MFLKNEIVYIQFHPVVYIVKLNIEMSMASLVVRLAQGKPQNDMNVEEFLYPTDPNSHNISGLHISSRNIDGQGLKQAIPLSPRAKEEIMMFRSVGLSKSDCDDSLGGIERRTDVNVVVTRIDQKETPSSRSSNEAAHSVFGDETPLHKSGMRMMQRPL